MSILEYPVTYLFTNTQDTTTSAGGVAIHIKVDINYSIDSNIKFEISGSESLWINIENDIIGKLTVEVIYHHPVYDKDSIGKFIKSIENVHCKIISQKRYFFVIGDINIDLLKIEKNENSINYANSLISSLCKCLINIPTRVNINSATLLDRAYTSLLKNILISGVLVTDISDHYPIFSLVSNAGKNYTTEKHMTAQGFTAFSKDEFNKALQEALNENVVSAMSINEQTKIFLNTFSNTVDKLAPFRKMTQKEKRLKRKPLLTCGILKSIKIKNKMFKNLHSRILSNNPNDLVNDVNQRYKTYRNALNRLISNTKRYYFTETLNEFFVNIGPQMALNIPDVEVDATITVNLQSHLSRTFFFSPATPPDVERLID